MGVHSTCSLANRPPFSGGSLSQRCITFRLEHPDSHLLDESPTISQMQHVMISPSRADSIPGLAVSTRVRLLPESDARRGTVSYAGLVPEIPGIGAWIGVTLDEPTGKIDGSVKGKIL
jgi:hypothetical protein